MAQQSEDRRSWRDAARIYLQPRVLALLFLGFSAGLPFLLVFSTLSAWLSEAQVARSTIGFFSWVGITYSVKVFWAPVVDRFRLPLLHGLLGRRRSWILLAQLLIALGLALMAGANPGHDLQRLALLAVLVAFASATQDIAIDAYRIEAARPEWQGAMAASYVFGYRLALLVAGAGALYIAEFVSWSVAYLSMAALMAVGVLTVLLIAEPGRHVDAGRLSSSGTGMRAWFVDAVVGPVRDFFVRNGWLALMILLLIGSYRISDITMGVMANPFYLDLGFSKADIATVTKVFGFFMSILGSFVGGLLVLRYGLMGPLLLGAVLVASTNLLFALLAVTGKDMQLLMITISADNLSGGIANAVFIAYLSALTNVAYTATQYALFSSLMTLPGKFIGGYSGVIVDAAGYAPFFLYAAAVGIPAILLVIYLWRRQRALVANVEAQPSHQ